MTNAKLHHVSTPTLRIAVEISGPPDGIPVVLLHGFPYDVRAYDEVVPILVAAGHRVIVPWLRGFGETSFHDDTRMRSGQQGALAADLLDLLDALGIDRAVLGGYDWGGRAACIVAALWPARTIGLVSVDGYNVQDIAASLEPAEPVVEASFWYQFYFQTERGRRGLTQHRDALCSLLWTMWSPSWGAAAEAFPASRDSLHNPDFVDVVIHSYRHRYGAIAGDAAYAAIERRIAELPAITVPTIVLEGLADGVGGGGADDDIDRFTGPLEYRGLAGIGHNLPQEAPHDFAQAMLDVQGLAAR